MVMLEGSYLSSLTPMTNMGASGEGADTTTRLAPPWMWDCENRKENALRKSQILHAYHIECLCLDLTGPNTLDNC
jgi:hypothetical protein